MNNWVRLYLVIAMAGVAFTFYGVEAWIEVHPRYVGGVLLALISAAAQWERA